MTPSHCRGPAAHRSAIRPVLALTVSCIWLALPACGGGTSAATSAARAPGESSGGAVVGHDGPSAAASTPDSGPTDTPTPSHALQGAGAAAAPGPTDLAAQVVAASDRDPKDREKDALRQPEALLRFIGVTPGMRVADLGAGSGYTTELLARAVGPEGQVFAQNNRRTLEKFVRESWPARLRKPVMANVVRVDAELSDPLPEPATELDRVTMIFFYHDAVALDTDMAAMNRDVLAALSPGGLFVIADHHGRAGSGDADANTLHRIDVEFVKQQVLAAGFELVGEADFLRDPSDTRDWKVWERGFQTDRFVLKFKKPQ